MAFERPDEGYGPSAMCGHHEAQISSLEQALEGTLDRLTARGKLAQKRLRQRDECIEMVADLAAALMIFKPGYQGQYDAIALLDQFWKNAELRIIERKHALCLALKKS